MTLIFNNNTIMCKDTRSIWSEISKNGLVLLSCHNINCDQFILLGGIKGFVLSTQLFIMPIILNQGFSLLENETRSTTNQLTNVGQR